MRQQSAIDTESENHFIHTVFLAMGLYTESQHSTASCIIGLPQIQYIYRIYVSLLFVAQCTDRIFTRRAQGVATHRDPGYAQGSQTGGYKNHRA